jgi:hypothetical protein
MNSRTTSTLGLAALTVAAAAVAGSALVPAQAMLAPGTPARDVHVGLDNDNATNAFIQPPGITAKQHMDNTDVLVGRANDDLLIGNLGGDTLLANSGDDILVGGPENFSAPNSDVMLGESGDDVNIWAPGDGSDAFVGHTGDDAMIFAPFVKKADGSLRLERFHHRLVPRVVIDESPQFSCRIVRVPARQQLGFDFLVRFNVDDVPVVTVRQERVESVYCPSPDAGKALVADLTAAHPTFRSVRLDRVRGVVGAILAPQG